jgi:hypothetical protein
VTPRTAQRNNLPALEPPQLVKLKQLTIVTLASQRKVRRACVGGPAGARFPSRGFAPHALLVRRLTRLACTVPQTLPYKELMAAIDVENIRELEDIVIECMYAGLLVGKLDQHAMVLEVQHASSRDIGPRDVKNMATKLEEW